jgi:hypothetical protein
MWAREVFVFADVRHRSEQRLQRSHGGWAKERLLEDLSVLRFGGTTVLRRTPLEAGHDLGRNVADDELTHCYQ